LAEQKRDESKAGDAASMLSPVIASYGDWEQELERAKNGAAFFELNNIETIRVSGEDASDLIHRLTMNACRNLSAGHYLVNGFTNEKGKMVDAVFQVKRPDYIELIASSGRSEHLIAWIDKYIFIEDVVLSSQKDTAFFLLTGAETTRIWGNESSQPFAAQSKTVDNISVEFVSAAGLVPGSILVRCPESNREQLRATLQQMGCKQAGSKAYHALRIAEGIPAFNNEIVATANPYEAGLKNYISYNKGCYIGQEVIARLDAYEKIKFSYALIGVEGAGFDTPCPLLFKDKVAGEITSSATGPAGDVTTCIAKIRRKLTETAEIYHVSAAEEKLTAKVIKIF